MVSPRRLVPFLSLLASSALATSGAPPAASAISPAALSVLGGLQRLVLAYQDLTLSTRTLTQPGPTAATAATPGQIVAAFANLTAAGDRNEDVFPGAPLAGAEQLAFLGAQRDLVLGLKGFAFALVENPNYFRAERGALRGLLAEQLRLTDAFDRGVPVFAPEVAAPSRETSASLAAGLRAAIEAYSAGCNP